MGQDIVLSAPDLDWSIALFQLIGFNMSCEERADKRDFVQTGGAGNSQIQVTTDRNLPDLLIF